MSKKSHHRRNKAGKRTRSPQAEAVEPASVQPDLPDLSTVEGRAEAATFFKTRVDSAIARLVELISVVDSRQLLGGLCFECCFGDPEAPPNPLDETNEAFAEYALSLASAIPVADAPRDATRAELTEFTELVRSVVKDAGWASAFNIANTAASDEEGNARYRLTLSYLALRGDAIPEHEFELIEQVFGPHNEVFRGAFGLTASEIIAGVLGLRKQINDKLAGMVASIDTTARYRGEFVAWLATQSKETDVSDALRRFHDELGDHAREELSTSICSFLSFDPFVVHYDGAVTPAFVKFLSMDAGSDDAFSDNSRGTAYWPTNASKAHRYPLLIWPDERVYCFSPQTVIRRLWDILESALQGHDAKYFNRKYQAHRARVLESEALRYLKIVLPGAEVFGDLYYPIPGRPGDFAQLDGLVVYGEYLLLVEAKAGAMHASARRGGMERFRTAVEQLITSANRQAARVREYLLADESPLFVDKGGRPVVRLRNLRSYRDVFHVNAVIRPLGFVATAHPMLRRMGLLPGDLWPWTICLTDLRIVAELIESPADFLLYLLRRLNVNSLGVLQTAEEMEYFMFFLSNGLHFTTEELRGVDFAMVTGDTVALWRYYEHQFGRVKEGSRPRLSIEPDFRGVVTNLQRIESDHSTSAAIALLSVDAESRNNILAGGQKILELLEQDGRPHSLTFMFPSDGGYGVTLAVYPPSVAEADAERARLLEYMAVRIVVCEVAEWYLLDIEEETGFGAGWRPVGVHRLRQDEFEESSEFVAEIDRFRMTKVAKWLDEHGRIGSYDRCPCGSPHKFKWCCRDRLSRWGIG